MEPMNGNSGNHNPKPYKHKSLLNKYDIPIDHLSFEYVGNCNDVKELERMVKILKSGEEGYYPDLLRSAEERLKKINPNSRVLRVTEPVLTKANFNEEEWNEVANDLKAWTSQMGIRDNDLLEANNNSNVDPITYPSIRKTVAPKKKSHTSCVGGSTANKRIASTDYKGWDKYDADTEIMKMDLVEKLQKQQHNKVEKTDKCKEKEEVEEARLQTIIKEAGKLTQTEREYLANEERNKGNEYYKRNYFDDAIRCYTTSIAIHPTAVAYSNRACCYLKHCKYTLALNDCNRALEMDPNNVKAYFRRAQALHKNLFHEALQDVEEVLKREPNQKMARHALCELHEHIRSLPRTVRLLVRDAELGNKKIIEVSEDEWRTNPKLRKAVEVTEWGLPKQSCNCYGTPSFLRSTSNPPRKAEYLLIRKQEHSGNNSCLPLTNGIVEDDNKMQVDNDIGFSNQCRCGFSNRYKGFSGDINRDITGTTVTTSLDEDDDDDDEDDVNISNDIRNNDDVLVDDDDSEDPFENNGNFYFGSNRKDPVNDNNNPITEIGSLQNTISFSFGGERGSDQPKRLEILEVETDTSEPQSVSANNTPNTCCSMDISEKHPPQPPRINGNLGLYEQDFVRSGAIPKLKPIEKLVNVSRSYYSQKTVKSSVNNTSKKTSTFSKETTKSSDTELEMCFNKIPTISIANKYKQKVVKSSETDTSAVIVPNDCSEMLPDLVEEVPEASPKKISPFQFGSMWSSKDSSSLAENAHLLRKIQPSSLHSLIGNKLDDQMLFAILQCLSSQFDLFKEQALVKEYLLALTHLERFSVIKSFLPQHAKETVCDLIDKLNDAQVKDDLRQAFGV